MLRTGAMKLPRYDFFLGFMHMVEHGWQCMERHSPASDGTWHSSFSDRFVPQRKHLYDIVSKQDNKNSGAALGFQTSSNTALISLDGYLHP